MGVITRIITKVLRVDRKEEKIAVMHRRLDVVASQTEKKWNKVNKAIQKGITLDIAHATGVR